MGTIVVLEPVWRAKTERAAAARRPESLEGKRIALLWNAKPNGDAILRGVGTAMQSLGHQVIEAQHKKPFAMDGAGAELIAQVAKAGDCVVNAVAD